MNNFINHLVSRHVDPGNHIKPRLRGKFEPPSITENSLLPDFENDPQSTTNITTEPQSIKSVLKPPFSINKSNDANSDKFNIDHPLHQQEQEPTDQFPAGRKDLNAANISPIKPLVAQTDQRDIHLRSDNANRPDETIFAPEINRILKNPKTGGILSDETDNSTLGNSLEKEKSVYQGADNETFSDNPDLQTIRTSSVNERLQNKLAGQVLPADLKWLQNIKQDLNSRNGIQNSQSSTPPVIKVTIGKIEVRAVNQSAPVQTKETPKPRMTLDDFLKQRNGGKS